MVVIVVVSFRKRAIQRIYTSGKAISVNRHLKPACPCTSARDNKETYSGIMIVNAAPTRSPIPQVLRIVSLLPNTTDLLM